MIESIRRPTIFIGSSAEQISIAEAIQEQLDFEYEPTVWSQDIFRPSSFALLDLIQATRSYDFAAFVFAPDDIALKRGIETAAVARWRTRDGAFVPEPSLSDVVRGGTPGAG